MYDKDNCVAVLTEQMQTEEWRWRKFLFFLFLMVHFFLNDILIKIGGRR